MDGKDDLRLADTWISVCGWMDSSNRMVVETLHAFNLPYPKSVETLHATSLHLSRGNVQQTAGREFQMMNVVPVPLKSACGLILPPY
jgi:hypothetical protein